MRPSRSGVRARLRAVLPYAVTVAVVAALLRRYRLNDIVERVSQGHAAPMIPIAVAVTFGGLPLWALNDTIVLRACLGRPRYLDVLRGKAGTAVLLALGYAFGNGGYGLWIARATGVSAALAGGIVLYVMAGDLGAISLVATFSPRLGGITLPSVLWTVPPTIAAIMIGLILVGPYQLAGKRLSAGVFYPWSRVPRVRGLVQLAGRCFYITFLSTGTWAAARAFGMPIPLPIVCAYTPVLLFVGSLPLSIAGFGAIQGVWVLAYEKWAPGEQILAFQFLWAMMTASGAVLRGLPFVRSVLAEIDGQREATPSVPVLGK